MKTTFASALLLAVALAGHAFAAAFHNPYGRLPANATPGDRMFADYFRAETRLLSDRSLSDIRTIDDWQARKPELRRQLFEMLGLDPLPPKTDLKATITGKLDDPEFTVEKLHFQSSPGLHVTANLYLPKNLARPAPAIVYGCGHSLVKSNGVSYGNKVNYQRHGIWFARHGFVCLVLDTVQLGEIEGLHHGTYREGMWWWNSRGYSPAGVEAWNCLRALDYLETRAEVDKTRFGVTGRSGGGAYSWWLAALDERIQATCPVAGITDLENHVVDGTVEGHCDCMFMVNTYRWDYAQVAALVAPRPLLICNTDKDTLFPLDGVVRLHEKVRRIYDLHGASDKLGLLITEGPHMDTQELQVPVFRWFNRFLKMEQPLIEAAAVPLFTAQQLKVFDRLPSDQLTSKCQESFTQLASDTRPLDPPRAIAALERKTFGGWPQASAPPKSREVAAAEHEGVRLTVHEFESQPGVTLRFYLVRSAAGGFTKIQLNAVDATVWREQMALARVGFSVVLKDELALAGVKTDAPVTAEQTEQFAAIMRAVRENQTAYVTFTPRGVGMTASAGDARHLVQLRRRFMLLGQTLAGMQTWDVRRAIQAARASDFLRSLPLHLGASPKMTEVVAFAALFEPNLAEVTLTQEPRPDKEAPDFLNWSRLVTPAQLLAWVKSRSPVTMEAQR